MQLSEQQIEQLNKMYQGGLKEQFANWDQALTDADRAVTLLIFHRFTPLTNSVSIRGWMEGEGKIPAWIDHLLRLEEQQIVAFGQQMTTSLGKPQSAKGSSYYELWQGNYEVRFTELGRLYVEGMSKRMWG